MDDFSMTNIDKKQFEDVEDVEDKGWMKWNEKRNGMFGQSL